MEAKKVFLMKRGVLTIMFCFLIISSYSQRTDLWSNEDLPGQTKSNETAFKTSPCCLFFKNTLKQTILFLNDQKESPRQNINSLLQFLGTLLIYTCGVLLRNIQRSHQILNVDFLIDRVQESISSKIKDCWTLQKGRLYSFYRRFWGNSLTYSNTPSPVYYCHESETQRAVSFIDIKESSPVSILHLARCGFYYTPNDGLVKCSGCAKQLRLRDFHTDPSNVQFHATATCPFVLSVSPSPPQEALGQHRRDETNSSADTFEHHTPSNIEAKTELLLTGYATGGQQHESDTHSSFAAPTVCEDTAPLNRPEVSCLDVSVEVSRSDGRHEARAPPKMENTKAPMKSSAPTIEWEVESDSVPLPSSPTTSDSRLTSSKNRLTTSDSRPTTSESRPKSRIFPSNSSSSSGTSSDVSQQKAASSSCSTSDDIKPQDKGARPKTGVSHQETQQSNTLIDGYAKNAEFSAWADAKNFVPQCLPSTSEHKQHEELVWDKACSSNDVHDGFFPVDQITKAQFPDSLQNETLHEFVMIAANLTVKLRSKSTSADRPGDDPCRTRRSNNTTSRWGAGFVYLDSAEDKAEYLIRNIKQSLPKSKKRKVKQFLSHPMGKISKCYFSVQTSRHLVFDNSEAKDTEVLLEIQDITSRNVKRYRAKGVFAIHDEVEGNYKTTLLCKGSDPGLARALEKERQNFTTLKQRLPEEVMTELLESCFVISHPHGLNKTVTFGHSTIVKYALRPQKQDTTKRQFEPYIATEKEIPVQDIREILMYTAGTCSGSSGGAVFTCRKIRQKAGQEITQLMVWTHNGVEKASELSCTVMSSYQPELTEGIDSSPLNKTNSSAQPLPAADNSLPTEDNLPPGPHATSYITMESRLASFKHGYKSRCKHSPLALAEAGFYFAGYDDCIKCFCCGLGLKGWNSNNDIHEEHQRCRPDCSFLKAHKDTHSRQVEAALVFDESSKKGESFRITLLKSERKKLASKFTCKVCWKFPASELFLACGDVFACERCSNFLYTCPVCEKPIYATVTTFLS